MLQTPVHPYISSKLPKFCHLMPTHSNFMQDDWLQLPSPPVAAAAAAATALLAAQGVAIAQVCCMFAECGSSVLSPFRHMCI